MKSSDLRTQRTLVVGVCQKRVIDVAISRGCPMRCSFCLSQSEFYKKYRKMPLDMAKEHISQVQKATNADFIWFRDDYLFQDLAWMKDIARHLKALNVAWAGNIRANDFQRMSEGYLNELKNYGCEMLLMGVESGNDEMLKTIRKGITVEMVKAAVTRCEKAGIRSAGTFICGYPYETREQMMDTARLILKLYQIQPTGEFSASVLRPYPGADILQDCIKLGYELPQSNEEWAELDSTYTVYHSRKELRWIKDYDWFVRFFNYLQTILYFKRRGFDTSFFEKRLFMNTWDSSLIYHIKKLRHNISRVSS
mgnify:CR=1